MAHPYSGHAEHTKSRSRVHHILKDHGFDATKHADGGAFSRVKSKHAAVAHETKAEGHKAPSRFARGGKVKHGKAGHHTNIAIVVPQKGGPPPSEPQGGAAVPPSPRAAPPPPMPGLPPGAPPGMPPPPMRARGGKVIDGDSSKGNLKEWSERAKSNSYARGGRLPTAGSMTGKARLQLAALAKGKR